MQRLAWGAEGLGRLLAGGIVEPYSRLFGDYQGMASQRLQFQPSQSTTGWDLSCQRVTGNDLSQLASQLDRDQNFKRAQSSQQQFLIDLSLNELTVEDLKQVVDLMRAHSSINVLVADNQFNWEEMRNFLQSQYPSEGLQWVKSGRLSMASTVAHHTVEQMMVTQALTTANLDKAAATMAELLEDDKETRRRRKHVDFGREEEVNRALMAALQGKGYSDVVGAGFKAIKGVDGRDEYSFDGMFIAMRDNADFLFVGKVKRYLEGHDVRDAEADRRKLVSRMEGVKAGTSPTGHKLYDAQSSFLQKLQDAEVVLYVGGATVLPDACAKAAEVHCLLVQPSGGRYQVEFPEAV